jgi:hypothetical protein
MLEQTNPDPEIQRLQMDILEQDIKHDLSNEKLWLFPTDEVKKVMGFKGSGGDKKLMFVGERPSSEKHGKEAGREFLYDIINEFNIGESHLTDLVKSRGNANDPYPASIHHHWRFFRRELAIVEPNLVFALSKKVYDYLYFSIVAERKMKLILLDHYSYAIRYHKEKKFITQLKAGLEFSDSANFEPTI